MHNQVYLNLEKKIITLSLLISAKNTLDFMYVFSSKGSCQYSDGVTKLWTHLSKNIKPYTYSQWRLNVFEIEFRFNYLL